MDAVIGGYAPVRSLAHRLDPRTKQAIFLLFLGGAFLSHSVAGLIASTAIAGAAMLLSNVGLRIWLAGLRRFTVMLVLTAGINLFLRSEGTAIYFYGYRAPFSVEAAWATLDFVVDLTVAIVLSMALTFSTTPGDLTRGCERIARPLGVIGVPVGEIALIFRIALRYIPVMQLELRRVVDAQTSRGIELREGGLITRARNVLPILVPALTGALRRGDRIAVAMTQRGFRPDRPRSEYRPLKLAALDYKVVTLSLVVTIFQIGVLR